MKHRLRVNRLLAMLLAGSTLCVTGCGREPVDVPALEEPVATNVSYRPVERGDIGEQKVLYATVVPMEYCSFYETNVAVEKLLVEPGDMVEQGQVVALADTKEAEDRYNGLSKELAYENRMYELKARLSSLRQQQLSNSGDGQQLGIEQENAYYDGLLHERTVARLQKEMTQLGEVISEGTLYARHSGQVVYTKNIQAGNMAGAYENVVVVADTEDVVLELSDSTTKSYAYEDYEVKYIKKDGKRYDVTEIAYTDDERILARTRERYPNIRLSCPDAGTFHIGDMYPVYYQKQAVKDVLIIAKEALYGNADGYYVLVKNENGDNEKRWVTVGETDDNYAEITEGLSENELVACNSKAEVPVEYEQYEVKLTNYDVKNYTQTFTRNVKENVYASEYAGAVTLAVKADEEVAEGQLLYTIDTGAGKAALTEAQYKIDDENRRYEKKQEDYDKQQAGLEEADELGKQILACQKEIAAAEHEYQLNGLQQKKEEIAKNQGGAGVISVYAKEKGTVGKLYITESGKVEPGGKVLLVETPTGREQLLVKMQALTTQKVRAYTDNIADIGEKITIETDSKKYTGYCVGQAVDENNANKAYLTTDDTESYISYGTNSGYGAAAFYVEMDDPSFYEQKVNGMMSFSYVSMQEVAVLPTGMIGTEKRIEDPNETYYYVWRLMDAGLVKQYIRIDKKLSDQITTVVLSGLSSGDILASVK